MAPGKQNMRRHAGIQVLFEPCAMVPMWFSELFYTRCDTKAETLKQEINVNKLGLVTVLQRKTQADMRAWTLDFYH